MESTSASEVKVGQEFAQPKPEEIKAGSEQNLFGNLESAVNDATSQIRHCDEQIALWNQRKQSYQTKMNEMLDGLRKQFGNGTAPKQASTPKTRAKKGSGGTVPELIRGFLEGHGPARTRDIRKHLLSKGKKTNPGVALSRMVKQGELKNTERGTYQIASK